VKSYALTLFAFRGRVLTALCLLAFPTLVDAQQFAPLQRLTNQEVLVQLSGSNGLNYRIDASTNLPNWSGLVTLLSTGLNQHIDSAAPYLPERFYRAEQLSTNDFTGDHLATDNGDVVMHPVGHASIVMRWNGKMIYVDPTNGAAAYQSFPRADLILVSHDHTDHFSSATLDAVRSSSAVLIVPQEVYNMLSAAQKAIAIVLTNGAVTNVMGMTIEAIPAYNFVTTYHPQGVGNGYVLTLGGKRLYMSGDTEDVPAMRALTNINVAFLCMNLPYTMPPGRAVSAVQAFRPSIVYPYHYRDSNGVATNATYFKQSLGTNLAIEVRLRKWY
jgi:L-ascorbate metabolism protein UlaG (beta-lactamase superfamily)